MIMFAGIFSLLIKIHTYCNMFVCLIVYPSPAKCGHLVSSCTRSPAQTSKLALPVFAILLIIWRISVIFACFCKLQSPNIHNFIPHLLPKNILERNKRYFTKTLSISEGLKVFCLFQKLPGVSSFLQVSLCRHLSGAEKKY